MDKLIIKNSRGVSNVFYYTKNRLEEISTRLVEYDILFIDSIIEEINQSLYQIAISKCNKVLKIKSGEDSKQIKNLLKVINEIDSMNIYPISRALVIGGGTVQDLAATCLGLIKRGTKWDFIPTSILAQCDSCIGSKTSINSLTTKNIYGLFYAPSEIHIINSIALKQSDEDLLSGYGDALHYLFLNPKDEYHYINNQMQEILIKGIRNYLLSSNQVVMLAKHCHLIKKNYIEEDEFDQNKRKVLNLGHSFGHAIEKLLEYEIPHGIAVMHGIYMAYFLNIKNKKLNNLDNSDSLSKLINLLIKILNKETIFTTNYVQNKISSDIELYLSILKRDKKNLKDKYVLVLLAEKPYLKDFTYVELNEFLIKVPSMIHDNIIDNN
tara:strand:- start:3772 stop:4914 length:1143 start_codon:yes stop_codon:yes gene_type:complete